MKRLRLTGIKLTMFSYQIKKKCILRAFCALPVSKLFRYSHECRSN